MKENTLVVLIIISVSLVGILGTLQTFTLTGAQIADGSIFISGYIDDNNNNPICEGRMKVIAQPGDRLVGRGRATGTKYFIRLSKGWKYSTNLSFYINDVSPVYCTSIETKKLDTSGKNIILDLRCEFKNINCTYYV